MEEREFISLIPHPKYQGKFSYFDVGIIEMDAPVNHTQTIIPVCLPERASTDLGKGGLVTVTGWGQRSNQDSTASSTLQETRVGIYSQMYAPLRFSLR